MKKYLVFPVAVCWAYLLSCIVLVTLAGAVEVPPITAAEFAESPEAAFVWQLLAGQGAWGAVLFAVIGVVWKFAKPYLDEWMRERGHATLWNAATTGVTGGMQTYVETAKAAGDGKLTAEQAAYARELARSYIISFMKTQGVDVIREYGMDVLNYMIEAILRALKIDNAALKAVARPLSASAPLPPSVTDGVMPGLTGGVSG